MKITVNIEAESAEDFKSAIAVLSGATIVNTGIIYTPETVLSAKEGEQIVKQLIEEGTVILPAQEKAPATRSRAKVEKVADPTPAPEVPASGTITAPELIGTVVTQSNDLLDSPAPAPVATNGQASLLDAPATTAPATNGQAKTETVTLNDVRNKIAKAVIAGTITKPGVTAFLANYETAKGQPCTIPSDIQEKDMALVFNAIDYM